VTCDDVRELAPDIALGLLSGVERAEAFDHLDDCPSCRALVDDLGRTADSLLLTAPEAEPPPGFETGALARIGSGPPPSMSARRQSGAGWAVAAACFLAFLLALAVLLTGRDGSDEVVHAPMITARGLEVGEAYVHGGEDGWVFLSMRGWHEWLDEAGIEDGAYELVVELDDGRVARVEIGEFAAAAPMWGGPVDADLDRAVRLSILDEHGAELCSADITSS
jgi:hypothetical protein